MTASGSPATPNWAWRATRKTAILKPDMIIAILGRQPELGLAELESRFGAEHVTPLSPHAAQVDVEADNVPAHLLGSAVKLARPLASLPTTDWQKVLDHCRTLLPKVAADLPDGKFKLGLSAYDLNVSLKTMQRSGLELKKAIKQSGRSVRIVPNTALELNSAQILHNQLTTDLGCELIIIGTGTTTHLAQTYHVQDIDDYARRDFGRPKRDAFVGMLPPKLAQTMLNLAQVSPGQRVLDAFCGTGVVLQEAALMGCDLYGTDLSERMIDYTRTNLDWLEKTYHIEATADLVADDARTATWQPPIDAAVSESYLGRPMTTLPLRNKLEPIMQECDDIARDFLVNLRKQIKPGTRLCLAVPSWAQAKGFISLPVVDDLEKIGYNRISFKHTRQQTLRYHRSDQIVARELLVLTAKE